MDIQAKLVLNEFMELGESPCWDDAQQAIYWVDTDLKRIHKYSPYDKSKETFQLDQKVGAMVKEKQNTIITVLENGFYRLNELDRSLEALVDPEADKPENIFNDGKCDKKGRFWAGTVHSEEFDGKGSLYSLEKDLTCKKKLSNVTISNGIAWTSDFRTMYYIDTPRRQVTAFDFDLETGSISNERVAVELLAEEGMPDGMTIDEKGNLWVAMWGGSCVLHCNPINGRILDRVEIPASNVTSCAFGGKNMDTLFITTAMAELTDEEKRQQPNAGGLFQAAVGIKGAPSYRFGIEAADE